MTAVKKPAFTAEDFLAWESAEEQKHEFIAGEVFAMAGAGDAHVTISLNLASALRNHLRGSPCRTYIADMKLFVETADAFFYPDVFVTCAATDGERRDHKREAVLVVEVLSPSTAAYDRGRKFAYYRELASLQEYVLIDTDRLAVEVYRRDASGYWVLHPHGDAAATAEFASVGCVLPLAAIYEDAWPEKPGIRADGAV